jgi:hypothetical protein
VLWVWCVVCGVCCVLFVLPAGTYSYVGWIVSCADANTPTVRTPVLNCERDPINGQ